MIMNLVFFTILIVEKPKNKFLIKYNMIIYFLFKILYIILKNIIIINNIYKKENEYLI